jgi:hypothetical protein
VRFHASDRPFSFLAVAEDRGSRFLKNILHHFPQEHCIKMTTVSIPRNHENIVCFVRGVQWNEVMSRGGGEQVSPEKKYLVLPSTRIN